MLGPLDVRSPDGTPLDPGRTAPPRTPDPPEDVDLHRFERLAAARGDHRVAFAAYEAEVRAYAKGCQKISGDAGPFLAPPTERRLRSRDRAYRVLSSRLLAGFFKRLTEKAASDLTLKDYAPLNLQP